MILDASVVVASLLPDEAWSDRALAVVEDVLSRQTGTLVPMTCWVEVAHGLVRAIRRGRLAALEVTEESLAGLVAHVPSHEVDAVESMRLALELGLGVYDCGYLVLSRTTGHSVITADRRLFEVGARAGYDVTWLGDLPPD